MFQFPSNGKAYTKPPLTQMSSSKWMRCFNSLQTGRHIQRQGMFKIGYVIVGFNSLQTGRHIQSRLFYLHQEQDARFNSLQTGRHIQREKRTRIAFNRLTKFQFPSNGKAYTKECGRHYRLRHCHKVSIPFKREGIYKGRTRQSNRRVE